MEYLKDPQAIYDLSFATIRAEADLSPLPESLRPVAIRVIHASGMTDLVADLAFWGDPAEAGGAALRAGAAILADCKMVAEGIIRARLPKANPVICTLHDPETLPRAKAKGTTRSAAALESWRPHLAGAVVAIGNAPTALFRLIEMIGEGAPRPAAIFAFPVGFVGARESKHALIEADLGIPYLALKGRRGGSAMAAAAVNALAGGLS